MFGIVVVDAEVVSLGGQIYETVARFYVYVYAVARCRGLLRPGAYLRHSVEKSERGTIITHPIIIIWLKIEYMYKNLAAVAGNSGREGGKGEISGKNKNYGARFVGVT